MHLLNESQKKAASHMEGPCLVAAGAGSGKTRVVIERITHLLAHGVPESAIVALTFTNKAAKEMVHRIQAATDKNVLITTFHSLGARIVRQGYLALGYGTRPTILDEDETLKMVKAILEEMGLPIKEEAKKWREAISASKTSRDASVHDPHFAAIYRQYQERMRAIDAIDFDDLLLLPLELLEKREDILDLYHARWRYFLVDEYQDTNKIQTELLLLLTKKERNLFVVGDPDQSIYSWRGAEAETMNQFTRLFPDHVLVPLEENYRSTTTILDAANHLIEHNRNRIEKRLWSNLGEGEKILYCRAFQDREEAAFVASQVTRFQDAGAAFSDMAIFYRTHAQSRAFEDFFRALGIPYRLVGALSFYDRAEIRDMIAFLRLLLRPHDLLAFSRVVNLPVRGIGKESIRKMTAYAMESSLPIMEVARRAAIKDKDLPFALSAKARNGLEDFCQRIASLREELDKAPLFKVMQNVYESMELDTHYQTLKDQYQEKKENVQEFIAKAREYSLLHPEGDLHTFLEEIALVSDPAEVQTDSVSMMSLHHAKGLEFDFVAIVGLEEGLLPHVNAFGSLQAVEEERRLFYVGITRAKKKLIISSAHIRFLWGVERESPPSRFMKEIPPHLLKRA